MKGFSLLEVMIACALSLLLMSGVMEAYGVVRRVFYQMDNISALIEKGEFAEHLMRSDIQLAGFNACLLNRKSYQRFASAEQGKILIVRRNEMNAADPCKAALQTFQYFMQESNGVLALYRKENAKPAVALLMGIKDFHVQVHKCVVSIEFVLVEHTLIRRWHFLEYSREPGEDA